MSETSPQKAVIYCHVSSKRQTIEGSTTVDTLMVAMRAYVRRKAPRRCVSMAYHQWRALTVFVNLFLCAHATLMAYFSYAPCNDGWFRD